MSEPPRRARSLAELGARHAGMLTADEAGAWQAFRPRPDDVIITPYGKCGTTWLQQIFHVLRTGGTDDDYDDISAVVPWIEMAAALGQDLDAPQRAAPRGFKSHLAWDRVPKGCRYIVAIRDPNDALVSLYRFMEGWFFEPGSIAIDAYARAVVLRDGPGPDYWSHLLSWWAVRHDPAVLMLSYERMNADPERAIRQVAQHCGIALTPDLLAVTLERSSLPYMLAHKHQFDDRLMRDLTERRGLLPPGGDAAKVRTGQVGAHRAALPPDIVAAMAARWAATVGAQLGFADYAALVATLD